MSAFSSYLKQLLRDSTVASWLRRLAIATISTSVVAVLLSMVFLGWQVHDWISGKPTVRVTVTRPIKVVKEQRGSSDTMPSLLGLSEQRARQVLADAGVDLKRVSTSNQPYAGEESVVIAQKPLSGSPLGSSAIALTISVPAKMPPLQGMPLNDARDLLGQIGASVTVETRYQPGSAENTVLETKPAAGEPLSDRATLVIAEPPSAVFLSQLQSISSSCGTDTLNVAGISRTDALVCNPGEGSPAVMDYLLNRRVSEFQAVLGLGDRGANDVPVTFRIFVDGRRAAVLMLAFGQAQKVTVPVVGALRIRLEAAISHSSKSDEEVQAAFANARFLGGQSAINELIAESNQ
jgi:beta-lactam-binding protein with PASTA domain